MSSRATPIFGAACWTTAGAANPWASDGDDRSPETIYDRVRWAAEAGLAGFGIRHMDLAHVEQTVGLPTFRKLLDHHGFDYLEIEFLENWYGEGSQRAGGDRQVVDFLRFAAELGPRHIKVGFRVDNGAWDFEKVRDRLAELSDQFEATGTLLAIEPMPYADVKTPDAALELIKSVGARNLGIVVDFWHTVRSGLYPSDLAAIPVDRIVVVEVADGYATALEPLIVDCIDNRALPGEGDFPVVEMVRSLSQAGYSGPWSMEMLSTSFRAMPAKEGIKRAASATRREVAAGSAPDRY